MRAKLIKETLDFQRGNDPKKSMRIGKHSLRKEFSEYYDDMLDYIVDNLDKLIGSDIKKKLEDGRLDSKTAEWVKEQIIDYLSDVTWAEYLLDTQLTFQDIISKVRSEESLKESVQFQRGKDPKRSLNIGLSRYSLENHQFSENDKVLKTAITEMMDLFEEEIYFMGDTRGMEYEYLENLTENLYNLDRIDNMEIEAGQGWIGNLELYKTDTGKICVFEAQDHAEYFGDIKAFNEMKTREYLNI